MRRLVRGFDVDAHEVEILQRGDPGAALGGVIGVEVAGRPGHVDPRPAEQDADAADQIDGRDDRPARPVGVRERRHPRGLAEAPEPNLRRRLFAVGRAAQVGRVARQDGLALLHERDEDRAAGAGRQVVGGRLVRDVVRRLALRPVERRRRGVTAPDEDVAVAHSGVELQRPPGDFAAAEVPLDRRHQLAAVRAGDVPRREVAHPVVRRVDEVAPNRPVVRPERDAHRRGFERRAAGVHHEWVVAEERQRRHVRRRGQRSRHVVRQPDDSRRRDAVHVRQVRRLQRRAVAETFDRLVGAAVGNDDDVLGVGVHGVIVAEHQFPASGGASALPVEHICVLDNSSQSA